MSATPRRVINAAHLDEVRRVAVPRFDDHRGSLHVLQTGAQIPFAVERLFYLRDVRGERADHAHRDTTQLLIPVAGGVSVDVSDGFTWRHHRLERADEGLLVPPMLWVKLHDFRHDTVLLVLADSIYDEAEYLRDWTEFVALRS